MYFQTTDRGERGKRRQPDWLTFIVGIIITQDVCAVHTSNLEDLAGNVLLVWAYIVLIIFL